MSGLQEEQLVPFVENLVTSGLVVESGNDLVALPHQLLREALMLPLSHLRQRAMHRQLAARLDFLHHLYDLLAPTASAEELWRLARALRQVHQTLGQLDEAAAWYGRELACAEKTGDVMAHFAAGELALVANNYDDAARAASKGLSLSSSLPDAQRALLMARGHRLLGAALAMEGSDLSVAEHPLQEAVAAHKLSDDREDPCAVLFELGNVAAQRGEIARALELYEEAAKAAEVAHVYYFQALAYNNLAYHHLLLGQLEAAQALAARGQHRLEEATSLLEEALLLISERGYWHLRTRLQLWLAETLLLDGRHSEAEVYLNAALKTAREHGRAQLLAQGERLGASMRGN